MQVVHWAIGLMVLRFLSSLHGLGLPCRNSVQSIQGIGIFSAKFGVYCRTKGAVCGYDTVCNSTCDPDPLRVLGLGFRAPGASELFERLHRTKPEVIMTCLTFAFHVLCRP